jgi:hypothetical protein
MTEKTDVTEYYYRSFFNISQGHNKTKENMRNANKIWISDSIITDNKTPS